MNKSKYLFQLAKYIRASPSLNMSSITICMVILGPQMLVIFLVTWVLCSQARCLVSILEITNSSAKVACQKSLFSKVIIKRLKDSVFVSILS